MAIGDTTTGFEYTINNGGPDPVALLLSTNLAHLALESGDSVLSNDTDTETEYYFNGITLNVAASIILNGYTVSVRYYVETEIANPDYDPDDPDSQETIIEKTYPNWLLNSSTFTVSAQGAPTDRAVFFTTTNAESLFAPVQGVYGSDSTATGWVATSAVAGIDDGSQYIYTKVFNQSQFNFIPRLSPSNQEFVSPDNGVFPTVPNDPANNIYPVNTITAYAPDPRRQVLLTYSFSFNYDAGSEDDQTTGITIEQFVTQPLDNAGSTLRAMLADSYYGRGFYGLDQWPVEEPALYEKDGTAITPIPRPDVLIPDASTPSGYAEYNQNTNGDGFPLVIDKTPDTVVEPPEFDMATIIPGVEIPGVDYTSDTYDNDVIPFD